MPIAAGLILALGTHSARAWDQDKRTIVSTSSYGILVGTLAGLLTLPVHGNGRTVFVGTSVGLYLGIVVGLYHNAHRYDPSNPLRAWLEEDRARQRGFEIPKIPRAPLQVDWVVAQF